MSYAPIKTLGMGELVTDAWGVQKISQPFSIFHGMFTYDIPPTDWFMFENGTQVYTSTRIVSTNGAAVITADSTKTTVLLEGRNCPRYQPNRGHLFSMAGWFPNKTNNGTRDFGLFTVDNGVFFRLKADGKLYAVLRSGASEVLEQEIVNLPAGFDVQKGNVYDIQYQWRGAGNYLFFIGDSSKGASKLVHEFNLLNTLTSTSVRNPALPAAFKATRIGADVVMNISCADITSENGRDPLLQYHATYALTVAATTDTPIISIQNPLTVSGVTNTRQALIFRIRLNCTKRATFTIWGTRDPTGITGATFQPMGLGSVLSCDSPDMAAGAVRATSITTAKLNRALVIPVEAAVTTTLEIPISNNIASGMVRGDYSIITCTAASADATVTVEWGESV